MGSHRERCHLAACQRHALMKKAVKSHEQRLSVTTVTDAH